MITGILVRLRHDPRRRVRDAEIEDLALVGGRVERLHDFGDRRRVVPPVDVEDVDVVGLELLQTGVQADEQGLAVVASVVGLQGLGVGTDLEAGRILQSSLASSSQL